MTICYQGKAHLDDGLEWGQAWLLEYASPEMQWMAARPAQVRRVLVARRKVNYGRRGKWTRYFVRLPDRDYGPSSYHTVMDHERPYGDRLFLNEVDAWDAYVAWMQRYQDRLRDKLAIGEQMLAEAEGIARLKRGGLAS